MIHRSSLPLVAALLGAAICAAPCSAQANVYATSLSVNEGTPNVSVQPGAALEIRYILNEAATLGVTIDFRASNTVVRSLSIPAGEPGTARGTNLVTTDATLPVGAYTLTVTAAASGYSKWTQLTDDASTNTYVFEGRGIAVNRNPASPYYGRIYVSNSRTGDFPDSVPGDFLGIMKFNADSSPAQEGVVSNGGYNWAGDFFSPWKVDVGPDDRVYVSDFTGSGLLLSWDPQISSGSLRAVLREDNYPYPQPQIGSFDVAGPDTNALVYVADANPSLGASLGIVRYPLDSTGIIPTNNTGTVVVQNGVDLNIFPFDVSVDAEGNIYTIQSVAFPADPSPRVLKFAPYEPAAGARTNAVWAIGEGDDEMWRASGVAVDPSGTYVAVAFQGVRLDAGPTNGSTRIFYATNGALAADLDLNLPVGGETQHENTDVAWDAAGNVYYIDNWALAWRAFSPPGTNQSTTPSWQTLFVGGGGGSEPVPINNVQRTATSVLITFQGRPGDTAASFTVSAAAEVIGTFSTVPATISPGSAPNQFVASVPASSAQQFYRVTRQGTTPPPTGTLKVDALTLSSGSVTLFFSGAATDQPAMFKIRASTNPAGPFETVPATVTSGGAPGRFQAVLPASGAVQFYQVSK